MLWDCKKNDIWQEATLDVLLRIGWMQGQEHDIGAKPRPLGKSRNEIGKKYGKMV